MCHRYRRQILWQLTTGITDIGGKFATHVNNTSVTGGKFLFYLRRYSQVKLYHQYQRRRWQISSVNNIGGNLPPVSTTLVANFPPVSNTPGVPVAKFFLTFTEIFASQDVPPVSTTVVANLPPCTAGVVETGGKVATGANNTGGKFAAGVNDTDGNLPLVSRPLAANWLPVSTMANNGNNIRLLTSYLELLKYLFIF
jgi:hypothetical protein